MVYPVLIPSAVGSFLSHLFLVTRRLSFLATDRTISCLREFTAWRNSGYFIAARAMIARSRAVVTWSLLLRPWGFLRDVPVHPSSKAREFISSAKLSTEPEIWRATE